MSLAHKKHCILSQKTNMMQELEDYSADTPSIQDELPTSPFGRPFPWSSPTSPSTDAADAADGVFGWLDGSEDDIQVEALQPSCSVASRSSGFCNTIVSSLLLLSVSMLLVLCHL